MFPLIEYLKFLKNENSGYVKKVYQEPFKEHDTIAEIESKSYFEELGFLREEDLNRNDEKVLQKLGIHIKENKLKAFYYVGCTWFSVNNKKYYIKILPKEATNKNRKIERDPDSTDKVLTTMLNSIWEESDTREYFIRNFKNIFWFSTNLPLIPCEEGERNLFLIITLFTFLSLMKEISRKGLKRDYFLSRSDKNFHGKLLLKETWQKFHSQGRLDKAVFQSYILSVDSLENRILKYTLYRVKLFFEKGNLASLLKYSIRKEEILHILSLFKGVSSITGIKKSDFRQISPSRFFIEYSLALRLALLILENNILILSKNTKKSTDKVIPYAINMPSLYELYVWSKYLKKDKDFNNSEIYYQKKLFFKDRVDFFIKKRNKNKLTIVEVKYKYNPSEEVIKQDIAQLARYLRNKTCTEIDGNPKGILIYPKINSNLREEINKSYHNIIVKEVPIK